MSLATWLYRGGRPTHLAMFLNHVSAIVHSFGVAPNYLVTLEVRGRRSGRMLAIPLVMAVVNGERYLVAMLGPDVGWVRNVQAAGGDVTLHHGRRETVHLEEVVVSERAAVLKAFLKRAPGARPHIPISKDAPLAEFARVAPQFPVFRVQPR